MKTYGPPIKLFTGEKNVLVSRVWALACPVVDPAQVPVRPLSLRSISPLILSGFYLYFEFCFLCRFVLGATGCVICLSGFELEKSTLVR